MVNLLDVYTKTINSSGQFQIANCSPAALEASYNTFKSAVEQSCAIYNDYRPYLEEVRVIVSGQWSTTFTSKENSTNFVNYNFSDNPPDMIRNVFPTNVSGLTPPYLYDHWGFNMEKKCFIWKYEKPTLYLMYPGRFNIACIYYHKITKHVKSLALTSAMTGQKIDIYNNDNADVVAQKVCYWVNRDLSAVFTAVALGGGKFRITNKVNGVSANATNGNSTWLAPVITQQGAVALPEITEFTALATTRNSQSKYITISSPTKTYYLYFSIDDAVGDPALDNDYLYYINTDYEDRIFFDLCTAKFMQLLGRARSSFGLNGLDVTNTGATMVSDGMSLEDKCITELNTAKSKYYLGWR